ncbi:MAG: hypothetical protein HFG69_11690 [Hungatella sp.]|nr:hypothetical protein [Hungatella sp.]
MITVYDSSYTFSGYIAQAYELIPKKYKHYFFIGDDLVLNPSINENNVWEYFEVKDKDSYIKEIIPLCKASGVKAERLYKQILQPFRKNNGTEWREQIPGRSEAFQFCRDKGIDAEQRISLKWMLQRQLKEGKRIGALFRLLWCIPCLFLNHGLSMPYPLFKGYSDLLIISSRDMKSLCHYFGVFAAMGVFVEIAIPTAIRMVCSDIKTEDMINKRGVEYWSCEKKWFEDKYGCSLDKLFAAWDEEVLYYHPVKLSKWQ